MKTITLEKNSTNRDKLSALDILGNAEATPLDRLHTVLIEELIDASILHEFACRCAETVISTIENPDQRSIDAVTAKRAWLMGNITNEELAEARNAAHHAAWNTPFEDAGYAPFYAAWDLPHESAWYAAWKMASNTSTEGQRQAARYQQVEMLIELLGEQGE